VAYIWGITLHARIQACHTADLLRFVPWQVHGRTVGHIHPENLGAVLASSPHFRRAAHGLELVVGTDNATAVLAAAVERLVQQGKLRPQLGEQYPVVGRGDLQPLLLIDRTAVAFFGVRAAGVHLNGYVRTASGIELWVATRARSKRSYPGYLDNLVAGGMAWPLSPRDTLVKECQEEAGLPAELAARANAVGAIHYVMQEGLLLKPDRLDLFDLELPADFVPQVVDGEVESFQRWPAAKVIDSLCGEDPWKPNCALVVIDFLLRHGQLDGRVAAAERWQLWQRLRSPGS
jgi:8-oxo-dGTP pyrophosphatase MutT (NUDIX family)